MATFPRREADIARLADAFFDGIARHQQDFPSIHFIPLFIANRDYKAARRSLLRIRADARQASKAKRQSRQHLVAVMKRCLVLSELDTAGDPVKLGFIGWGPPAAPRGMTAPNAPRNLSARRTSQGDIMLQWTGPSKTGNNPVRNYLVQQRLTGQDKSPGPWELCTVSCVPGVTVKPNSPSGSTMEYRVIAANLAGQSAASNTVCVAL